MDHAGGCHCGNIHVLLRLSKPPEHNPVRTCTCSFCRSHNPRMISDPGGLLELSADDWSLVELYRFGTRTADFVICRHCGVFIAAISDMSTEPHAVVNVGPTWAFYRRAFAHLVARSHASRHPGRLQRQNGKGDRGPELNKT